jgi:CheY-like chemotaxis protein
MIEAMTEPTVPERTARALHELGNLLAVALGRVEGLLAGEAEDNAVERQAALESIRDAILRARDTVRGIPRGDGAPQAAKPAVPRPRVLIIDDESLMRETLAGMLTGVGYDVITAASGEEGIETYRQGRFDCVITDAKMPGISGLVVARAIKDHDATAHVVMLSGLEHDPHELHAAGVDRVLMKPTRRAAILDAVRRSTP